MKYSYPGLNACVVVMSGYLDSQRSRNDALGATRHIGTNLSGSKVDQREARNEKGSYLLPGINRRPGEGRH